MISKYYRGSFYKRFEYRILLQFKIEIVDVGRPASPIKLRLFFFFFFMYNVNEEKYCKKPIRRYFHESHSFLSIGLGRPSN